MIEIDGNRGGGQVLRTALSLSMVTGQPFSIRNIRGTRPKPGLMRQHLTCVRAAAEVARANVDDVSLGDRALYFEPRNVKPGNFEFAVGSAGSTTLVFQTLLPALAKCGDASRITISGGTHNPMAPSATFIGRSFLPVLGDFEIGADLKCEKVGFAPSGGGRIAATIGGRPVSPRAGDLDPYLHILSTGLPDSVPTRIGKTIFKDFGECGIVKEEAAADGSGGCVHLIAGNAVIAGFAEKGTSSERLGRNLAKQMTTYLESDSDYTTHLADQLMLYLALKGEGSFTTTQITRHIRSNAGTISEFLPVVFTFEQETDSRVRVTARER